MTKETETERKGKKERRKEKKRKAEGRNYHHHAFQSTTEIQNRARKQYLARTEELFRGRETNTGVGGMHNGAFPSRKRNEMKEIVVGEMSSTVRDKTFLSRRLANSPWNRSILE